MGARLAGIVLMLGAMLLPAAAASAQSTPGTTTMLTVDAPTTGAQAWGGQSFDIGGWSSGTQVSVYLDSPTGQLLGTASVDEPRPDVVQVLGRPDLANSGFDVTWLVSGVTDATHTLFVVATGGGPSTTQQIPITVTGVTTSGNLTNMGYGNGYETYNNGFAPYGTNSLNSGYQIGLNGPYVNPYMNPGYQIGLNGTYVNPYMTNGPYNPYTGTYVNPSISPYYQGGCWAGYSCR